MKPIGVIYIVAAIFIAAFSVANWDLLVRPIEMSFLVARVQAPLALLLLLVASVIFLLDFGMHALREQEWMRDRRAAKRALETARQRAEQAENERANALTATIQREFAVMRAQLDRVMSAQAALLERGPANGSDTLHSSHAFEPELIPPRDAPGRGAH